ERGRDCFARSRALPKRRSKGRDMTMNRTHRLQAIAALSASDLVLAAAAAGGSPGHWSTIASGKGTHGAAQDIGLVRTADGTLHVAWKDDSGSSAVIRTSSITAS